MKHLKVFAPLLLALCLLVGFGRAPSVAAPAFFNRPFYNISDPTCISQDYIPVLTGATTVPTGTYSTQYGEYTKVGGLCYFTIVVVTSNISGTTAGDTVRLTLPFTAATHPFSTNDYQCSCEVFNATPAKNGNVARIPKGAAYVEIRHLPLTTAEQALTYASGDLGVLSNVITFRVSGFYQIL